MFGQSPTCVAVIARRHITHYVMLAMLRVARQVAAQRLAARIVLQIHDELVLETPLAEVAAVERLLREEMLQALPLEVPLEVSVHAGATWAACEKGAPTG